MNAADPLVIWTIYERPRDYPEHIVARRWLVYDGLVIPTRHVMVADELETLRDKLHDMGLLEIPRGARDDSVIVEVWL